VVGAPPAEAGDPRDPKRPCIAAQGRHAYTAEAIRNANHPSRSVGDRGRNSARSEKLAHGE
jgi:hypothetical protein